MKKVISIIAVSLILVLVTVTLITPAFAASKGIKGKATQITTNPRYDRNPSFLRANDGTYWLFYAGGQDSRNIRDLDGYNPDLDYYDVYYKTANSIPGLEKAVENQIPLKPPDNAQRDIATIQATDGTIWVFVSTGLGPGSDRGIYYYTYDRVWHGPSIVPDTDCAAHISVLEKKGEIWVFFDIGYTLYARSYDETAVEWSTPIKVADSATVAKAIVDETKFYVVWTTASGDGIYLSTSANGIDWSSISTPIAAWPGEGTTNWDPALIKDKDIFRLFWAPDAGIEGQFIATSTSADPTDPTSWSPPIQLTTASYGTNNWWDFWPQPYDKGAQYLLYTSERNSSGTGRVDGNIWMAHLTVPLTKW